MRPEDLRGPLRLAELGEEVPEPEDMADLVDQGLDLLLPALGEHLGIDHQLVAPLVGEEGAREHAAAEIALVALADHELEVPEIIVLGEPHRGGVAPRDQRVGEEPLDLRLGRHRVLERIERTLAEAPPEDRIRRPERDEALRGVDHDLVPRAAARRGEAAALGVADDAFPDDVNAPLRLFRRLLPLSQGERVGVLGCSGVGTHREGKRHLQISSCKPRSVPEKETPRRRIRLTSGRYCCHALHPVQ